MALGFASRYSWRSRGEQQELDARERQRKAQEERQERAERFRTAAAPIIQRAQESVRETQVNVFRNRAQSIGNWGRARIQEIDARAENVSKFRTGAQDILSRAQEGIATPTPTPTAAPRPVPGPAPPSRAPGVAVRTPTPTGIGLRERFLSDPENMQRYPALAEAMQPRAGAFSRAAERLAGTTETALSAVPQVAKFGLAYRPEQVERIQTLKSEWGTAPEARRQEILQELRAAPEENFVSPYAIALGLTGGLKEPGKPKAPRGPRGPAPLAMEAAGRGAAGRDWLAEATALNIRGRASMSPEELAQAVTHRELSKAQDAASRLRFRAWNASHQELSPSEYQPIRDDFMRSIATLKATQEAAAQVGAPSELSAQLVRDIRNFSPDAAAALDAPMTARVPAMEAAGREAAGAVPPGPPPEPPRPAGAGGGTPLDEAVTKLRELKARQPVEWQATLAARRVAHGERAGAADVLKDKLIAEGMHPADAIRQSRAPLRGQMPITQAGGLELSREAEVAVWDRVLARLQRYEQDNIADMFERLSRDPEILAQEGRLSDLQIRPFEMRLLQKAVPELAEDIKAVLEARTAAIVGEKMAGPVRGVSGPPLEIPRAFSEARPGQMELPDIGPKLTGPTSEPPGFWEAEQFRTQMGLRGPRGEIPGPVGEPATHAVLPPPGREVALTPTLPGLSAPATAAAVASKETAHFFEVAADSLGIPRALMTMLDDSVFRQLSKTIARHPVMTKGAVRDSLKAMNPRGGQEFAVDHLAQLRSEGTGGVGYRQIISTPDGATRDIGLGELIHNRLFDIPGTPEWAATGIRDRPEFYVSRWVTEKPLVKESARAWATGWNAQYSGLVRYWLQKATKMNKGSLTPEQVNAVLNGAERLTGKGYLGKGGNPVTDMLKVLGFAPGWRVSGPEAWVTLLSPKTDPAVRRMMAEELLTWVTLGNSIMTVAKYAFGASVITTLGSTQFGRMKFPGSDTYYNIWGTDNVLARAIIQGVVGVRKDSMGNVTSLGNGKGGFTGFTTSMLEAATQYLKSGQDPIVGLIAELSTGKTYLGEPMHWDVATLKKMVMDRTPIIVQSLRDINETDGPIQALLSFPGEFFGVTGTTSYRPTSEQFRALPKWETGGALDANKERELEKFISDVLGKDGWEEQLADKYGPPNRDNWSSEDSLRAAAVEWGVSNQDVEWAIAIRRAAAQLNTGNLEWVNPAWIQFILDHESELRDRYPGLYQTNYIQQARQERRETAGVR